MDLFDLFQQYRIESDKLEAKHRAVEISERTTDNQVSIVELQSKVDHLSLVCMALTELLEEFGIGKQQLLNKMKEVDFRDGKLDGKLAPENKCSGCSRVVSARHYTCLYCGTKLRKQSPF